MRKINHILAAFILLFLISAQITKSQCQTLQAGNNKVNVKYKQDEIILKLKISPSSVDSNSLTFSKIGISSIDSLSSKHNVTTIRKIIGNSKNMGVKAKNAFTGKGLDRTFLLKVRLSKDKDIRNIIREYNSDPNVEYAEPNYIYSCNITPNDPKFQQLYGLENNGQTGGVSDADIDASNAWDIQRGSDTVVVAVIDTGIDYNHEDLLANIWVNDSEIPNDGLDNDGNGYIDDVNGWDFCNNDKDPKDDFGHGTHCAGTIGAVGNNGIGVVGVNWNVKIMPVKFLGSDGSGTTEGAINSILYAVSMGADILSNSWGGGGYSQGLSDAISAANNAGVLCVCAAGNSGENTDIYPNYPSGYDLPNVISVAATDHNDQIANFSNYGANSVDLGAPGVNILSTVPTYTCNISDSTGYKKLSGTSMATPHVAGVAALIKAQYPMLTSNGIKAILFGAVDKIPSLQGKTATGGRLNALNCFEEDTIPPFGVNDLGAIGSTFNSINLVWTATGDDGYSGLASAYDIRYSTSPINDFNWDSAMQVVSEPNPQPSGSYENFSVSGLVSNTGYFFAMKVIDNVGNISTLSNCTYGSTKVSDAIFSDNMEHGANGWVPSGLWHQETHRSNSPTTSWAYNTGIPNYNYDSGTNYGSLTSPVINLSSCSAATLNFKYLYQTEDSGTSWDQRWIQIGVNGVFNNVAQLYNDNMLQWNNYTLDLSPYLGQNIQIRFFFNSIDSVANNYEGWYIDDVVVVSDGGAPNNLPPVAIAGLDQVGQVMQPVNFNGSSSYDTDGTIINYNWNFGDGYIADSAIVSHIYNTSGVYTVVLSVTDDDYVTSSDSCIVQINAPLVLNSIYPSEGYNDTTTYVTLYGENFDTSCKVYIGGLEPYIKGGVDTPGSAYGVSVSGQYAYVADLISGLQVIDISNDTANIVKTIATNGSAYNIHVRNNYAYVACEYGLEIVDISDPLNPIALSNVSTPGVAFRIQVSGNYAYLACQSAGLQIVDISDPYNPHIESSVNITGYAIDVYLCNNRAYLAVDGVGLYIIDVSNPTTPVILGNLSSSGIWSVAVAGNYAYLGGSLYELKIVDISNPVFPTPVSSIPTANMPIRIQSSGKYLYVTEAESGLQIIDISNPNTPVIVSTLDTPGFAIETFISGNNIYLADGYSGLQIINRGGVNCEPVNFINPNTIATEIPQGLNPGQYDMVVENDLNGSAVLHNGFTVLEKPNWPPVAEAGPDQAGQVLQSVNFNGSGSYDPDGIITNYNWNFGDGSSACTDSTNISHMYNTTGTFLVTLIVTDNKSSSGYDSCLVTITNETTNILFRDDMESGQNGWTAGGSYNLWELGVPTSGPGSAYSGINVRGTRLNGNYGVDNAVEDLTTKSIDLRFVSNASLVFRNWYSTEAFWDGGAIFISMNDGPWQYIDYSGYGSTPRMRAFTGNSNGWVMENVDLTPYVGNQVKIRFEFFTDGSINNYPGWYIDDVIVSSDSGPGGNQPPVAEAGLDQLGQVLQPVIFNASGSYDTDGQIVRYEWNFGDYAYDTGMNVSHSYYYPGEYIVTLAVEDNNGAVSYDTCKINILTPLTINSVYPYSGYNDTTTTVTIFGSGFDTTCKVYVDYDSFEIKGNIHTTEYPRGIYISNNYAYLASYYGIQIIDLTNDSSNIINNIPIYDVWQITGRNNFLYLKTNTEFKIMDITDPYNPVLKGTINNLYTSGNICISGNYVYISDNDNIRIIDISNPDSPNIINSIYLPRIYDIASSGNYVYAVGSDGLFIIDVTNPSNPQIYNNYLYMDARCVEIKNNYAYVSIYSYNGYFLNVIDVTNPASPFIVNSIPLSNYPNRTFLYGNNLFVAEGPTGVEVIDVSAPYDTAKITTIDTPLFAIEPFVSNNRLYVLDDCQDIPVIPLASVCEPVYVYDQNTLMTVIPMGLQPGSHDIGVKNSYGQEAILTDGFTALESINYPPFVDAGPDQTISAGHSVTFYDSAYDSDGYVVSGAWDFGDGNYETAIVQNMPHIYESVGTYNAVLTVWDNKGAMGTDTCVVTVINIPPVAEAGPNQTVSAGDSVTFYDSAYDPDGYVVSGSWNFGDGNYETAIVQNMSHIYESVGTYKAILTVYDNKGGVGSDTCQINVVKIPLTPIVDDKGDSTNSTTTLYASWISDTSGITEYQYKITTDTTVVRNWTSTGTNKSVTASGLVLVRGKTYYFSVKAKNNLGYWSNEGYSNGIKVNSYPVNGTVSPFNGKSLPEETVTFTAVYSDPDGYQNIKEAYLLFNTTSTKKSNCADVWYDQVNDKLYLRDNDDSTWLGGYAPGTSAIIENSYASLDCSLTTVSGSGNVLTITSSVTFKPAFIGKKNIYLYVKDKFNTANGWSYKGTWLINSVPSVGIISPSSGSSRPNTEVTFTAGYSDPDGWQNIKDAYLIINTSASGTKGLYLWYDQNNNKVYLRDDYNTTWGIGKVPGDTSAVLENSYVKVDCSQTVISGSDSTMTIPYKITFKTAFMGAKKSYLKVVDDNSIATAWIQQGTWTIINLGPAVGSITPVSGLSKAYAESEITVTYSDPDGWQNIKDAYLIINTSASGYKGLYIWYDQNNNKVYLRDDYNTTWGVGKVPGDTSAVLENNYVKVDCSQTVIAGSDSTMTIPYKVTFKSLFVGTKKSYLYVRDDFSLTNGWIQKGNWTITN